MKTEFKAAVEWLESEEGRSYFNHGVYIGEIYSLKSDLCELAMLGNDYCTCDSSRVGMAESFYSAGEFNPAEEEKYLEDGYIYHPYEKYAIAAVM